MCQLSKKVQEFLGIVEASPNSAPKVPAFCAVTTPQAKWLIPLGK
jgi:hypothetical protein